MRYLCYLLAVFLPLFGAMCLGADSYVSAQIKPKALTGTLTVIVDGKTIALTDSEKTDLAQRVPAIKAALPVADQSSVDWQAALTVDQRIIVGADLPDAWSPDALVARWKAGGASLTRAQAAAQLEVALIAQKFLAR